MFHVIVLTVATVILILVLTVIGVLMTKKNTTVAYPPAYNTCPDYWTVATDGSSCILPTAASSLNVGSMYTSAGTLVPGIISTPGYNYDASNNQATINFSNSGWTGVCSMQSWANNYGIVWDGVSNYNSCTSS